MLPEEKKNSPSRPFIGAAATIVACLCNASMTLCVKSIDRTVPDRSIVFFRFFTGFVLLSLYLISRPKYRPLRETLRIQALPPYIVRTTAGLSAMYAFFYTIKHLEASQAVLMAYTSPVYIPLLYFFWRGVPVPRKIFIGLLIGFTGIFIILKPNLYQGFSTGIITGILSGILIAVSVISMRILSKTEKNTLRINFYFFGISSPIALLIAGPSLFTSSYPIKTWGLLFLIGIFGMLFQILLTFATGRAKARYIGIYLYFSVIFTAFGEWLFFNRTFLQNIIPGTILVIAGVILMTITERKLNTKNSDFSD